MMVPKTENKNAQLKTLAGSSTVSYTYMDEGDGKHKHKKGGSKEGDSDRSYIVVAVATVNVFFPKERITYFYVQCT